MITASHNPKEYNGYKVYGGNGCQINSPLDEEISAHIKAPGRTLWPLPLEDIPASNTYFETISEAYYRSTLSDLTSYSWPQYN